MKSLLSALRTSGNCIFCAIVCVGSLLYGVLALVCGITAMALMLGATLVESITGLCVVHRTESVAARLLL